MPPEMTTAILCVGIICMIWAGIVFVIKRASFARYVKASGVVLELVPDNFSTASSDRITTYAPRISYETGAGEKMQFIDPAYSYPPVAKVGERIEIIFDPQNPKDAVVNRWDSRHLGEGILFGAGLIATAAGVFEKLK